MMLFISQKVKAILVASGLGVIIGLIGMDMRGEILIKYWSVITMMLIALIIIVMVKLTVDHQLQLEEKLVKARELNQRSDELQQVILHKQTLIEREFAQKGVTLSKDNIKQEFNLK